MVKMIEAFMCESCGKLYPNTTPFAEGDAKKCELGHDIYQIHPINEAGDDMPIALEVTHKVGEKTMRKAIYSNRQFEPVGAE